MHTNFAGHTCVTRKTGVPLCVSPFPQPRAAPFKKGAGGADVDAGLSPLKRTIVELAKWPDARDVLPLNEDTLHVCAILQNGSSTCDGEGDVPGITLARAVGDGHAASFFDATDAFACVRLDSGEARCAADYFEQSHLGRVARTLGHPSAVSVGEGHACAIGADGLVCWGSASRGQLGDGTPYNHARPAKVPNINDAMRLSVGPELTCVIHKDGALSCWGAWRDDSSVRSRASEQFTPVRITPPFAASNVFVGSRLSNVLCAMGPAGASCLMGADWMPVTLPHRKIKGIVNGAVVTDDNRAFGFGWEGGRIVTEPEDFEKAGIRIASVAPDDYCGVTQDGDVVCGHCGGCNGAEAKKVMTRIHGTQPFVEVTSLLAPPSVFNQVVCARTASGTAECYTGANLPWGRSTDLKRTWEPELAAQHDLVQISAYHGSGNDNLLCTLDKQGAVRCLGDDNHGQRGARQKGSTELMPVVMDLPPVVEIGTAADHACARTAGGDVYCWGSNERGGAPDGAPGLREAPVKVAPPG